MTRDMATTTAAASFTDVGEGEAGKLMSKAIADTEADRKLAAKQVSALSENVRL